MDNYNRFVTIETEGATMMDNYNRFVTIETEYSDSGYRTGNYTGIISGRGGKTHKYSMTEDEAKRIMGMMTRPHIVFDSGDIMIEGFVPRKITDDTE